MDKRKRRNIEGIEENKGGILMTREITKEDVTNDKIENYKK